ncbi:MAG: signal peptide peptidase SppA [Polyangiales bacterium]
MRVLVLAAYNVFRLLTWPVWALWCRLKRKSTRIVELSLRGRLEELPRSEPLLARWLSPLRTPRNDVASLRVLFERMAKDVRVEGLLLRIEPLEAGYPTLSSVRELVLGLRAQGKRVACYLPLDAGERELFVATAADEIVAMPHAGFSALGPRAARSYLAPLLDRLGVRVLVTAEGRYKTAAEPLVRASMSGPEREQLEAIVRTLHRTWSDAVGLKTNAAALLQAGLFGAERAKDLGVLDAVAYEDELPRRLGLADKERPIPHRAYLAGPRPFRFAPVRRKKRVAVLRLAGTIAERTRGADGIDLHGSADALRRLAEAPHIAGVVLYIDSPGGSAVVSELLHREIALLDAHKPVVSWMGNYAASGGYYLAAATRAIVAHPATLTGSIGVVSIRPVAERLMELLHVRRELVSVTPYADLNALTRAPSPDEEALLRAETERFYQRFLEVVATGRKRALSEIAQLAEGRVWSGYDAREVGLVDQLGGYREARAQLDKLLPDAHAIDAEPLWVAARKRGHPGLPARQPPERREPPPELALVARLLGVELPASLWLLLELAGAGERVLAFAPDLPSIE